MLSKHSVDQKLLWEGTIDVGSHKGDLELIEGYLARIVCVQPIEHLLKKHLFLIILKILAERCNQRLTERLALIKIEPAVLVSIGLLEGCNDQRREPFRHLLHGFLIALRTLVHEVIEHQRLVKVDTNELRWRRLNNVLDSFSEASLDLDMHFHVDGLGSLWVHL